MRNTSTHGGPLESANTTNTNHASWRVGQTHEAGHAYYGTTCPTTCQRVDEWAARRLITPRQFLQAARTTRDVEEIAQALWVTPTMVSAYIRALPPDDWLIMRRLVGRELVWPNTDLENVGHTDSAPMTDVCSTY